MMLLLDWHSILTHISDWFDLIKKAKEILLALLTAGGWLLRRDLTRDPTGFYLYSVD